jgi:multidrug efflux pump subunit AcrA (membrane-fusion protein)
MKYLKNKILWGAVVVILIIILISNLFIKNNGFETVAVKRGDLNQSVTVSGKIVPAQEVDLSFEI